MIRITFAALAACLAFSPACAHDGVHVNDPYAVVVSPSSPTASVYFVIENHAIEDDRLIAATTDAAQKTMLHQSMEVDGVMTMAPMDEGFPIAGSGRFALERGGAHLMLLGLTKPLADGDTITMTLTFARAGEVVVEVPVNPTGVAADDHSGHVMPGN
jgi:periplasmic copper chaperone A